MKRLVMLAAACVAALAVAVPMASAARRSSHAAAAKPSGLDKEYLKTSMGGDLFEMRGGALALRLSHNAAVRKLAATLIKDHTQSYHDAVKLAKKYGVQVQTEPLASMQWELEIVGQLRGAAFNRWYSRLEIKDHEQDISEAQDEVSDGSLKAFRQDAKKEIPTLKKHLALSRAALKASK